MIQRIQSVYLLLVAILLVVALCLPVGQFIGPDGIAAHIFKPLGVTLADGNFQSTWGLFGILLLSAIIALCTIFLFRNRMLQVRMTVFGSLLLIGYYIDFFAYMFQSLILLRSSGFFQAEDGILDKLVTGVQTCALPIYIYFLYIKYQSTGNIY